MENEKKVYIFLLFFQWLEMKKKKSNEKKNCTEPFLGYCVNYIVKKKIVLQESNCIAEKKRFEG